LFSEREKRIKPFRDDKIITSWNGLALSGLAEAINVSAKPEYREAAERTVEFIFSKMFKDGLLLHTYRDGTAKLPGFLDDYALLGLGLLDLYEGTFERNYLERALELAPIMLREFWDEADGGFFFTGNSHEQLISRAKPIFDGSIPSGNAMATQLLLRLFYLTGTEDYLHRAEKVLRSYYDAMENQPFGFAHLLCALDFHMEKPKEVVIVIGSSEDEATALIRGVHSVYLPNKTLQLIAAGEPLENVSPVLAAKMPIAGKTTAYVCHNFTCSAPVTSWDELKPLLVA